MNTDQKDPIKLTKNDACISYLSQSRLCSMLRFAKENDKKYPSLSYYIPGIGVLAVSFGRFVFVLEGVNLSDDIYTALLNK